MGDLSEHFSRNEFVCHHCKTLPVDVTELVHLLEHIRGITGRPLIVVSGYRCPEHNQAVGGARASQHLLGRAADLRERVVTSEQARQQGARGIGRRGGYAVHVDVRAGTPRVWDY